MVIINSSPADFNNRTLIEALAQSSVRCTNMRGFLGGGNEILCSRALDMYDERKPLM